LRLLGDEFGAFVNIGVIGGAASSLAHITLSDGRDPKLLQEYNDHYCSLNFILPRVMPSASAGQVASSADFCDDNDVLNSGFYQDFLRRLNVFYLVLSVIATSRTSSILLTLGRSRNQGLWTSTEKEALAAITPHLRRAARFSDCFLTMRQERDEVLDRLPMGVIVLDESGRVQFLNRAAETVLEKRDGLWWGVGGISAISPGQTSRLRSMISDATLTASKKSVGGGGSLSISRSSLNRPLSVLVAPLMPSSLSPFSQARPCVVIFITDPDAVHPPNQKHLAELFGLTPAESRVADQLVQGKSLGGAADELGITSQTARTHLKRIFGKTDTNRQSELMRLLISSPASLHD
jgi:DNA-binding CsgD family transcriptional regulator